MKKSISIILVMLMVLLSSCQQNSSTETTNGDQSNEALHLPRTSTFTSFEELETIMEAAELPEAVFAERINQMKQEGRIKFTSNQDELLSAKTVLQSVGYPLITAQNTDVQFYLTHYPDKPDQYGSLVLEIMYVVDGLRYHFDYFLTEENRDYSGNEYIMTVNIDDTTIELYQTVAPHWEKTYLTGQWRIDDYLIVISVDRAVDYTDESVDGSDTSFYNDISFDIFRWGNTFAASELNDHVTE